MFDEILIARLHTGAARSSAALLAVGRDRRALQVAAVADCDRDLLVGNQVFEMNFSGFVFDDCSTLIAVEFFNFFNFGDDDFAQLFL
jgi:hypothetical protein